MPPKPIESTEDAGAGVAATTVAEPILEIDEIQGNVLVGFNKPQQAFLFLRITDAKAFRGWLAGVVDHVTTTAEVLAFKRLWKAMRRRRGGARPALETAWFNLGFTASGLEQLDVQVKHFSDDAFRDGLGCRSSLLGDPTSGPGSPSEWFVGGPGREPDVLLLFAADTSRGLAAETKRLAGGWVNPGVVHHGAKLLHRDRGRALPEGREHFGFVDGISQPGIRGSVSDRPGDFLTPRCNPRDPDQGISGQDLIWPGEFVFGYASQDPSGSNPGEETKALAEPEEDDDGSFSELGEWTLHGSFLVYRRLGQDVEGLDRFLDRTANELGVDPRFLAAKLVGRWRSGAPLRLAPRVDDPALGSDVHRRNDFKFGRMDSPLHHTARDADPDGLVCPLESHIRKVNPRDDFGRFQPNTTLKAARAHRILRRGIPFGPEENGERGLLFLAYQTSIQDQFEFVQVKWANKLERFFVVKEGDFSAGIDPVIGKKAGSTPPRRPFRVHFPDQSEVIELDLPSWVWPQGGGYFFCPSISGLGRLSLRR